MRGVFTCGVLDYLMDRIFVSPVIGVSAEHVTDSLICHGNADVPNTVISICWKSTNTSVSSFVKAKHSGFRSSFYEFPEHILPYDYDAYFSSPERFVMVTTNCLTGEANYFEENRIKPGDSVVRASVACRLFVR